MPADDLVGPVALEPLGAEVPARHGAVRVEQEDGVVGRPRSTSRRKRSSLSRSRSSPRLRSVRSRVTLPKPTSRPSSPAERGDHDVGPELRAVLADPPALVLEAAVGGGDGQLAVGQAASTVVLRVEGREVPADDLVGGVALQPLGAGVPGDDVAVGVERRRSRSRRRCSRAARPRSPRPPSRPSVPTTSAAYTRFRLLDSPRAGLPGCEGGVPRRIGRRDARLGGRGDRAQGGPDAAGPAHPEDPGGADRRADRDLATSAMPWRRSSSRTTRSCSSR